jgi:spermidine/putrescine-binding protein
LCLSIGLAVAGCSCEANAPSQAQNVSSSDETLNVDYWNAFIEPSVISDLEKEFGIKVQYHAQETRKTSAGPRYTGGSLSS